MTIDVDASGGLTFSVASGGTQVVSPSHIGITVDGADLGANASLGAVKVGEGNQTFSVIGGHSVAQVHYIAASIPVTSGTIHWMLQVCVFDGGAAYRYRVPGTGGRMVNGESSSWTLPPDAHIWYQSDTTAYEGLYSNTTVGALKPGTTLVLPTTAKLPGATGYVLITEANLVHYSDLALKADTDGVLRPFFYADAAGWQTQGVIVSPWRVTLVSADLNGLVNTDILQSLCPPASPELANATWIQPGRSIWQWWNSGNPKYADQHQWVDWTKQIGFEYYLIDEGWKKWKASGGGDQWAALKETVDYAKSQGVKVIAWVRMTDIIDPQVRDDYLLKAQQAGLAGLKIDFPPPGSVKIMDWDDDTLRLAAKLHLVIDYHGAVKPTGRERTWPNEINREGIRGHEYHIRRYHRVLPPEHDTILPFTRMVAGHADYTPTAFNPNELVGYTWSRELAQAIVLGGPFLCYADKPTFYLANPALDVMQAIPATWDETIVLPGSEIGQTAAFARRKGSDWFIGIINGGSEAKIDVPLTFLGQRNYTFTKLADVAGNDAAFDRSSGPANSSTHLMLDIQPKGGFVGWLKAQ